MVKPWYRHRKEQVELQTTHDLLESSKTKESRRTNAKNGFVNHDLEVMKLDQTSKSIAIRKKWTRCLNLKDSVCGDWCQRVFTFHRCHLPVSIIFKNALVRRRRCPGRFSPSRSRGAPRIEGKNDRGRCTAGTGTGCTWFTNARLFGRISRS